MADWSTIASISTATGTLVLALATFSSVRSSQRSARVAERALLLGLRPVLTPSRLSDPPEKVMFGDRHYVEVDGGTAAVEADGENIYFVLPLRNAGAGLAVLHAWYLHERPSGSELRRTGLSAHAPPEEFRRVSLDLYVPAGDTGFWQGAVRDADDPFRPIAQSAVRDRQLVNIDLLYSDEEGGQRTISRFTLAPRESSPLWSFGVIRHWRLESRDPRA